MDVSFARRALYRSISRAVRYFALSRGSGLALLLGGFLAATALAASGAPPVKGLAPAPLTLAEDAVAQMAEGRYAEAAEQARNALKYAPDDPTLHALAGAILLSTGDIKGALPAFHNATTCDANDSLACYGLGLAQLAHGERAAALASFQRSARAGGDPAYLLVAQRYTQWLDGVQMTLEGVGLPDDCMPAIQALQGLTAARQGDARRIAEALQTALDGLPGDMISEPRGLLMTFDKARPLDTAAAPLPESQGLHPQIPNARALSGNITLTPEGLSSSVAYVAYQVDGQPTGLINTPPFQYTWDSRTVPNGWHLLSIVLYDQGGREINRAERRIRTFNAHASVLAGASVERMAHLRSALWKALALHPDRCACAYLLGTACRALGQPAEARVWFARAAAIHPSYRDTRQQLAALGGLGEAGETIFGGPADEKVVALTFDDGPKPGITEPLLEVLKQNGVQATFFVVGKQVALYPNLARQIAEAGMEVANHTYSHPNLMGLSAEDITREILRTQAAVEAATGKVPRFLRPPGGNWTAEAARTARHWGLTPCFWTVDAYAAEVTGPQQVANLVLGQVRPGSIVLMHNGKMSTVQALPTIIRVLRERGYSFVTVETMARRLAAVKAAARAAAHANAASN